MNQQIKKLIVICKCSIDQFPLLHLPARWQQRVMTFSCLTVSGTSCHPQHRACMSLTGCSALYPSFFFFYCPSSPVVRLCGITSRLFAYWTAALHFFGCCEPAAALRTAGITDGRNNELNNALAHQIYRGWGGCTGLRLSDANGTLSPHFLPLTNRQYVHFFLFF